MSLIVWLPFTKDLTQQGISDLTVTNNGATFDSNGKLGGCYYFDGSAKYMQLSQSLGSLPSGDFSYAVWLKPTDSTRSIIISDYNARGSSGTASSVGFELTTSRQVRLYWGGNPDIYATNCILPLDTWTHVAISKSSSKIEFYMNGVLTYTYGRAVSARSGTACLRIGDDYRGGTSVSYKGYMNDVRIYDHALSAREVKEIAQGLVCHYKLDGEGSMPNLAKGTNTNSTTTNTFGFSQQTGGSTRSIEIVDGVPCAKITRNSTEHSGWAYLWYTNWDRAALKEGTSYIISMDILGSGSGGITFGGFRDGNSSNNICSTIEPIQDRFNADGWSHLVFQTTTMASFEGKGASQVIYMNTGFLQNTNAWIMMKNMKVEEGSINTPWQPHSSDTAYTYMGYADTTEYDRSGFGNNGVKNGSLTVTSDTPRYSVSTYIPSAGYITHSNVLDNTSQQWTCCAWVKLSATTSGQALNNFNLGNKIIHASGKPLLYLNSGTNDYYVYGSQAISADEWTHIAFVFDNQAGIKNVYTNGVLTNGTGVNKTSTPSGIPNTIEICKGAFDGYISDYREYATALSADDIKQLYEAGTSIDNKGMLHTYELVEV